MESKISVWEKAFLRVISSILIITIINLCCTDGDWTNIEYTEGISIFLLALYAAAIFIDLTLVNYFAGRKGILYTDAVVFVFMAIFTGVVMLIYKKDIYLTAITVFFVVFAVYYVVKRFPLFIKGMEISERAQKLIILGLLLITLLYVGTLLVLRFFLFKTPNFDFGIFSQMFYYMKETGMPMTTTERNYYLSHFAIHFSPIFYLILPIYMLFPHPVTLIVVQLLIVFSGIIPIYLICKSKRLSGFVTVGLVSLFILYPTMRSGLFYDFHENKFLTPLILWLLYFLDNERLKANKKRIGVAVFTILTLMVKEDAAIYVACIGIFTLVSKKKKDERLTGLFMLLGAVVYFLVCYNMLDKYGAQSEINSIGRYENMLVNEDDGLADMVLNILKDPAYAISQLLSEDKLEFVLWTMLPVLFVPLLQKKASAYILLIPYMVINLFTNYGYQYDINFQYTYGSCTLLFYMVIMYFEGRDTVKKRICIILMIAASLLTSTNAIASRNSYLQNLPEKLSQSSEIFEVFDTIPEDKSVSADTWFVPALSQRKEVYEYSDDLGVDTDYIVLDMRTQSVREKNEEIINEKLEDGYQIFTEIDDLIVVLEKIS